MTIVEMCVHMDCSGCERKIRKTLQKLEGVDDIDIDMEKQKVTVSGHVDQKKVLKAVRKTGRRAVLWPFPYSSEQQSQQYFYGASGSGGHPALATGHSHHASYRAPASSYNYYKHGYDDSRMHGYYQPPAHSSIVGDRAGDVFSDENPNACSVM